MVEKSRYNFIWKFQEAIYHGENLGRGSDCTRPSCVDLCVKYFDLTVIDLADDGRDHCHCTTGLVIIMGNGGENSVLGK